MKGMTRMRWIAAAIAMTPTPTCGFLSSTNCIQRHCYTRVLAHTENEITPQIFEDEFASLVESHPLDDVEPSLSAERQQESPSNGNSTIPTDPQEEWIYFYSKLKQQHLNNSINMTTPNSIMEQALLRHWMAQQRKAFMKTLGVLDLNDKSNGGTPYLSRRQKELLDNINFPWGHLQPPSLTNDIVYSREFQRRVRLDNKDWKWNGWYIQLCKYIQQFGHSRASFHDEKHADLAKWTAEQRKLRWKLPERRRKRLDDVKFDWNFQDDSIDEAVLSSLVSPSNQQEQTSSRKKDSFPRRVKELKQYRTEHGNVHVPLDDPGGLGEWVERIKGRRSELSPSSVQKLELLGLVFYDKTTSQEEQED